MFETIRLSSLSDSRLLISGALCALHRTLTSSASSKRDRCMQTPVFEEGRVTPFRPRPTVRWARLRPVRHERAAGGVLPPAAPGYKIWGNAAPTGWAACEEVGA